MPAAPPHQAPAGAGGRLHTLDGLRGVAALAVVTGHAEMALAPFRAGHYQLAVDLFFLMSGVVLGRAYAPRLAAGLSAGAFMRARYLRLYPMVLVGMLLGIAEGWVRFAIGKGDLGPAGLAAAAISGLLLLPSPTWAANPELVPLDPPVWSLLFELAANLLFALLHRRLSERLLRLIVAVAAAELLVALLAGPGLTGSYWQNWAAGLPRVIFPFFLGVLIQRHRPPPRPARALPWLLLAGTALLLVVRVGGAGFAAGTALLLFPAITWVAAGLEPTRPAPFALLGRLSFPIYTVHLPLLKLLIMLLHSAGRPIATLAPWSGLLYLLALLPLAWALDRWVDAPVRGWLAARLFARPGPVLRAEAIDTPL